MGNTCKASQYTLQSEINDEIVAAQEILVISDWAIFKDIYKQEYSEIKSQHHINALPLINLELLEPNQFITPIKLSRRSLSIANDKQPKIECRSRTSSHKQFDEKSTPSKKPYKSSIKSLNSKNGGSQKSQKSVRWDSDLSEISVFVNLTRYQNQ